MKKILSYRSLAIFLLFILVSLGALFIKLSEKNISYFIAPFSGRDANYGNSFARGLNLFVDEQNKKSRFRKYTITSLDHQGQTSQAITSVESILKLSKDIPILLHGSPSFLQSLSAEKSFHLPPNAKMAIQYDEIIDKSKNIFCLPNDTDELIENAWKFINENLKTQKIAVIADQEFKKPLERQRKLSQAKNYSSAIKNLTNKSTEEMALLLLQPEKVYSTLLQLRQQGFQSPVVVVTSLAHLDMHEQIRGANGDNYLITDFSAWTNEEPINGFIQNYMKQYNERPNHFSYYGYVCAKKLLNEPESSRGSDLRIYSYKVEGAKAVKISISQ